nr:rho guanine nucleotide exchange factor 16 isoform X3 [Anser cygnoides]
MAWGWGRRPGDPAPRWGMEKREDVVGQRPSAPAARRSGGGSGAVLSTRLRMGPGWGPREGGRPAPAGRSGRPPASSLATASAPLLQPRAGLGRAPGGSWRLLLLLFLLLLLPFLLPPPRLAGLRRCRSLASRAATMSRSPPGSNVEDKPLLLEYRCHPLRQGPPTSTSPSGTRSPDSAPLPAAGPFPLAEPRRIVLSTDSPAALKVGTQQLIPRSLAVSTKTKNPSRHPSTGAASSGQEPAWPDQKRASIPSISLEEEEDEEDGRGMLKRNLRNMSYRAAMKGLGTEPEPVAAVPSLKPVLEDGGAPPARSPGRNKRTFGRKRVQKRGGSFKDQPRLYQEIRERGLNSVSHESDEDLLEEPIPEEPSPPDTAIVVQSYRPAQVTWSQLPEVLEAGVLDTITPEERKRQEAMFEIITSEYSYMHSLSVLVSHFMRSEELKETMTQTEHHHLFSNIGDILAVSTSFFEDLEKRHQENLVMPDISDIVEEHASKHFNPYVSYCSNEVYQQRTLQRLLTTNPLFKEALKQIERKPECGGLPMISFLILPMQRVTRLPLLLDTVCQKTKACTAAYGAATRALKAISKGHLRFLCSKELLDAHVFSLAQLFHLIVIFFFLLLVIFSPFLFGDLLSFPSLSSSPGVLSPFRKPRGGVVVLLLLLASFLEMQAKSREPSRAEAQQEQRQLWSLCWQCSCLTSVCLPHWFSPPRGSLSAPSPASSLSPLLG